MVQRRHSVSETATTRHKGNMENRLVKDGEETEKKCKNTQETDSRDPDILEEIEIEDFTVDGICGVY